VAWDNITHSIIAGTQDNGVIRQTGVPTSWSTLINGDGNYVGVTTVGGNSYRYFMGNNFNFFFRETWTGADTQLNPAFRLITNVTANVTDQPGRVQITTDQHGLVH
jgi:hypothetical protein